MERNLLICLWGLLFMVLFFNASLYAQSSDVQAKAREAVKRLDEILSGKTSGAGIKAESVQTVKGGKEPSWVNNAYAIYSKDRYITAVGFGKNRVEAEKQALVALASIFGQSIQSDFSVATAYSEAIKKGNITVSENTRIQDTIVNAVAMDTLIGAEIGNIWEDDYGVVYVLAFVEKETTIAIYTEMIRINLKNIENLTAMNIAQKNTFDGYARYKLAALIADINVKYAHIVMLAGGSTAALNLTNANSFNIEASNILKNIAISINIQGDRNNRIKYAFAKALNSEGLKTKENNAPYTLRVTVNLSEVAIPNNKNKFCQYLIDADLIENATGLVLIPFNLSDRTSHLTYERAVSRAITAMEKAIGEQYSEALKECLAVLLPQK